MLAGIVPILFSLQENKKQYLWHQTQANSYFCYDGLKEC